MHRFDSNRAVKQTRQTVVLVFIQYEIKKIEALTRLAADFCCMLFGFVMVEKNNEMTKNISVMKSKVAVIKHKKETTVRCETMSQNERVTIINVT